MGSKTLAGSPRFLFACIASKQLRQVTGPVGTVTALRSACLRSQSAGLNCGGYAARWYRIEHVGATTANAEANLRGQNWKLQHRPTQLGTVCTCNFRPQPPSREVFCDDGASASLDPTTTRTKSVIWMNDFIV